MAQDGHGDDKDNQKSARLSEIHLGSEEIAGIVYELNRYLVKIRAFDGA
jgi:hypothetical protein